MLNKRYQRIIRSFTIGFVMQAFIANVLALFYVYFKSRFGWDDGHIANLILIGFGVQILCDIVSGYVIRKVGFKIFGIIGPVLVLVGLICFICAAFVPIRFAFMMFALGIILFNIFAGFYEIVISTLMLNLPVENSHKIFSKVHGTYSFSQAIIFLLIALLIKILGVEKWQIILVIGMIVPIITFIVFITLKMDRYEFIDNNIGDRDLIKKRDRATLKHPYFILAVTALFCAGAIEVTLTQWLSAYTQTIGIDKTIGDIISVAGFSFGIAFTRLFYSKYAKSLDLNKILIILFIISTIFISIIIFVFNKYLVLVVAFLSGFSLSMVWPGAIMLIGLRFKSSSAFIYAVISLIGDVASAFGPWLVGQVSKIIKSTSFATNLAQHNNVSVDVISMKTGLSLILIFAFIAIVVHIILFKIKKKYDASLKLNEVI